MAGLYAPLPTLRRRPRGRLRTDRGRRGLLLLHRSGLSPHTPRQSPGALTTDFDRAAAGFSPDRCDALFWAFSELMVEPMAGQGFYDLAREHTEALEARKAQVEEAARIVPVYAGG